MKTGIISRPTMNAFDRTSVVNSETATMRALFFIVSRLHRRRQVRGPRDADEDVVQRRPRDLEVVDGGASTASCCRNCLRIAGQPDLLHLAVVVHRLDARRCRRARRRRRRCAHGTVSKPYCAWISSSVPSSTFRPAKDHEDAIAHLLGGRHVVRAEDDGRAAAAHLEHRVLERLGVDRVEAGERLVEDQQRRARRSTARRTAPSATCPSRAPRSSSRPSPCMPSRASHSSIAGSSCASVRPFRRP